MSKKANRLSVSYGFDIEGYTGKLTDVIFTALDREDKVLKRLVVDTARLPQNNKDFALAYGVNKLCSDRTSEVKDKVAKLDAMADMFEFFCTGERNKERVGGFGVVSIEVEALARFMKMEIPAAQKALAEYDKAKRAQILANPGVLAEAKRITTERAGLVVKSLDDLLPQV